MENTTVSDLNSKRWYRGLKVLYLIFVIACYSIAVASSIGVGYQFSDEKQYYLQKQEERSRTLEEIRKLKEEGYTTKQISERYKINGIVTISAEELRAIYETTEGFNELYSNPSTADAPATMLWLLLIIPGLLLLAWFISQLPKWIFYYVMMGTIKPKK